MATASVGTGWAAIMHACLPCLLANACLQMAAIITDADRPLAMQRLRQTNVLSVVLERMLQPKVAAHVNKHASLCQPYTAHADL